jgi:hypothetical protein
MNTETIYVDSIKHCHRTNDGMMTAVETEFFIGKCNTFVEGYCYDDSKGYVQIYPWKPYSELDSAQREHEKQQLLELQNKENELNISYTEGVNSI